MFTNLNESAIDSKSSWTEEWKFADHSVKSGPVSLYLRNLEDHLIDHIKNTHYIFGCVAWLTNPRILTALTECRGVSFIVQKEDFLRPDMGNQTYWRRKLRRMYHALPTPPLRCEWQDSHITKLSFCADTTIQSVRCVGNFNQDKHPAFPRMHHKFIVFCNNSPKEDRGWEWFHVEPFAVWTGSFNFTENSTMSLENAVVIHDPAIAQAYFQEWKQILAISEPLDWTSVWSAPEWRVGS